MTETSLSPSAETGFLDERRDTDRAVELWLQKASERGGLPSLAAFDLSRIINGDLGYRFIISAGADNTHHTFLIYGSQLVRLLELPEAPEFGAPLAIQLPDRYSSLFVEGCGAAIAKAEPTRMSGIVVHCGQVELYRAVFMPLAAWPKSPTRLIFGSFNRRISTMEPDAVRRTKQSFLERWLIPAGLPAV